MHAETTVLGFVSVGKAQGNHLGLQSNASVYSAKRLVSPRSVQIPLKHLAVAIHFHAVESFEFATVLVFEYFLYLLKSKLVDIKTKPVL